MYIYSYKLIYYSILGVMYLFIYFNMGLQLAECPLIGLQTIIYNNNNNNKNIINHYNLYVFLFIQINLLS